MGSGVCKLVLLVFLCDGVSCVAAAAAAAAAATECPGGVWASVPPVCPPTPAAATLVTSD